MNDFYAHTMLNTQRLQEETGLSASEILALPADEYARLTNRPTPTQAALQALDAQYEPPGTPRQEPAQVVAQPPAPEAQGIDVAGMDMQQYAALRGQLGMGGREYGRGIFDGGGTAEWVQAAQAKAGRHGWQGANVQQSPQLGRAYVQQEQPPAYRSAADRFTFPGSAYQG